MYAAFYIQCLLLSMTQICVNACGTISIDQNPHELRESPAMEFTCTVTTSCNFSSYLEKDSTILAQIPPNGIIPDPNINIIYITPSAFTVTVKMKEKTHLGVYYCGAIITIGNQNVKFLGCGTHIYSGGHSFGTNTGIVFSILCACIGMMNRLL
ncbi:uncharacterized protein LOC143935109 isoform X2 [Lithobates pipiens]